MKISFRWIQEMLPTPLKANEAASILTATGLEVEAITKVEDVPGGLRGLVVGTIVHCSQHPNADRLQVCQVDLGEGEPTQIVCGAPNAREGLRVVVATVGSTLYPSGEGEPFKIKKGKIRGEVSLGMICGEDEIGVGSSKDGIIELDEKWTPGTAVAEVYDVGEDQCIEIGLTPNRTDGMSHYGVARDLRAGWMHETVEGLCGATNLVVRQAKALPEAAEVGRDGEAGIALEVRDAAGAPRYMGVVIAGLQVGPSPEWVQRRLQTVGVAPINNVVDATNYVLHELGQPLHAFDCDAIEGGHVIVRRAEAGEALRTLDGVERTLHAADLVIADAVAPMCLAGVFGGEASGVTEGTTRIFLESALFEAVSVRKTAKRYGLATDASFRFERGVDPEMTRQGLERAAGLILDWAGGKVVGGVVSSLQGGPQGAEVRLERQYLDTLIGEQIEGDRVESILGSLDIGIEKTNTDGWNLSIPAYRKDVTRPADVVEEILRIHGYDRVPVPRRMTGTMAIPASPDCEALRYRIAGALVQQGYTEIMSNSLTKADYGTEAEAHVEMLNPLSSDLQMMRQNLLHPGLEALAHNIRHQRPDLRLFEMGRVYFRRTNADDGSTSYDEQERLALWISGRHAPENWNRTGEEGARDVNFYDLHADVGAVLHTLGLQGRCELGPLSGVSESLLLEGMEMLLDGKAIGCMGRVHPDESRKAELEATAFYVELAIDRLFEASAGRMTIAEELPKFPAVRRDLSLLLPEGVAFARIREASFEAEPRLLKRVGLFDVYEGEHVAEGQKSYAVSLTLQDPRKTLTDKHIDKTVKRILDAICRETGAQLR